MHSSKVPQWAKFTEQTQHSKQRTSPALGAESTSPSLAYSEPTSELGTDSESDSEAADEELVEEGDDGSEWPRVGVSSRMEGGVRPVPEAGSQGGAVAVPAVAAADADAAAAPPRRPAVWRKGFPAPLVSPRPSSPSLDAGGLFSRFGRSLTIRIGSR